jgi:hypothetical protein
MSDDTMFYLVLALIILPRLIIIRNKIKKEFKKLREEEYNNGDGDENEENRRFEIEY